MATILRGAVSSPRSAWSLGLRMGRAGFARRWAPENGRQCAGSVHESMFRGVEVARKTRRAHRDDASRDLIAAIDAVVPPSMGVGSVVRTAIRVTVPVAAGSNVLLRAELRGIANRKQS